MGWKVIISPGLKTDPGAFTVDAKFKFDLQGRVHDDENGKVQYIEFFLDVEGDVVKTTPSDVADTLFATLDELKKYQPRNVYLELDGTTKYTWTTTTCVGSPRVLAFRTVDQDGNADSHWRYGFTIYIKQGGNIGNNQSVMEFETSLQVITENGIVVKKIWSAYAKSTTVAAALALVMTFKPSDKTVTEEITRFFQQNAVRATWTWELIRNYSIVEEPVTVSGNGKSYVWDYAIGDGNNVPPPILHRAANEITRIVVRGVVRGSDPGTLVPPPPHYSESANLARNQAEESNGFPAIEDPVKGIYQRPYMEVWYWSGSGQPPAPNHSGHLKPQLIPPSNGPIGAQ